MIRNKPVLMGALVACSVVAGAAAQPVETRDLLETLRGWHDAFLSGRIDVDAQIVSTSRVPPPIAERQRRAAAELYGDAAKAGGALAARLHDGLTHLGALRVLLDAAETQPSPQIAHAVLRLAAAGLEKKLSDHRALRVREAAQWTLMRMDSNAVLASLMRVAAGETEADAPHGNQATPPTPELRVAALRAIGAKNLDIFRSTIESALLATDPRVRLAAAEALSRMRRREPIPVLVRALGSERHPVVTQAVVEALDRTMRRHVDELRLHEVYPACRTALRRLGRVSWRVDLGIVALLERFPIRESIPVLIDVLDEDAWGRDELTEAVNEHASPILRERAWRALRRLTGAILPDDAAQWRTFWASEQDRVVLQSPKHAVNRRVVTSSQFYGIPVTGREVAFLIDCSHSMKRQVRGTQRADPDQSRLEAAKDQLLRAVQGIHSKSRYHLLTFSATITLWNGRAVRPTPESFRQLTSTVSRIGYESGTDIFGALMRVLDAGETFGVPHKNPIDEVFLLSDGEPVSGEVLEPEIILKIVRELNRYQKIRIHTVFVGTSEGASLMRRLAEQNDGYFVRV